MPGRHNFRERLSRIRTKNASLPEGAKMESPFERPITLASHFEFLGFSFWKTLAIACGLAFAAFFAQFIPPEMCSPFVAVIFGLFDMIQSFNTPA